MRTMNLLKSLLGFLLFGQCRAAIMWYTIGCDSDHVEGDSIEKLWNSAAAMSSNAQSTISMLDSAKVISPRGETGRAANNAKYMWGISFPFELPFTPLLPLPKAAKDTLKKVSDVYAKVNSLMSENNGYLICSGNGLKHGTPPGYGTGVWYAELPTTKVPTEEGEKEQKNLLILRSTAGGSSKINPCDVPKLAGQTFEGRIEFKGELKRTIPGILLCASTIRNDPEMKKKGALTLGYDATGENPDPDDYSSAAGTLLHEMVHAIDTTTYKDQVERLFRDKNDVKSAYGFSRCYYMAKERPEDALVNPDNYAIFAEMCMSPKTRWMVPTAPPLIGDP